MVCAPNDESLPSPAEGAAPAEQSSASAAGQPPAAESTDTLARSERPVGQEDPLLGTLVDGRYLVQQRIDIGGMSTVYRALDRRLDRLVALKILHPTYAQTPDFLERFQREARSAARLAHSGVVAVYDQGSDGQLTYLAMEYIAGPNLRTHLRRRGTLSLGQALAITEHVLNALAAAHRIGLVHRDIKPENVLLPREGGVKVADFGLARAVTQATNAVGGVLGTVAYLAPEVISEATPDARADIYSVGVMLYELITGRQPLTGQTPVAVAFKHLNEGVPAPSLSVPWLPTEVDEVVAALTTLSPDERPADGAAALALVRRCREQLDADTLARRAAAPSQVDAAAPTEQLSSERPGATAVLPKIEVARLPASAAAPERRPHKVRERRNTSWIVTAVVLLALAAVGGIFATWYYQNGPGAYSSIPKVAGISESEARSALEFEGFATLTTQRHDDEVAKGNVISSKPAAGERLKRGQTVTLEVSLGKEQVTVPDVTGRTVSNATDILRSNRLGAASVRREEYSAEVEAGVIIATDPTAGTRVDHSSEVTLVVSLGPKPVPVPSVVSMEKQKAQETLEAAGFTVQLAEEYHDDVPAGHVISQDPQAATDLVPGSPVSLLLSKGPALVEIPNLIGKNIDEGVKELEGLGLVVKTDAVIGGLFGTIRSLDPAPGTQVPIGSTVTVRYV
ncbi:Stk1 family PASTA domain-containing Ser/Thr kinase [Buchananella hordeovulneris]|uniref:Stk1 family PASTA domain-containing Ser/Thr kinase n=1 Tax=Buchananella hordeovulneris TaxID=52770 RepID=UPI00116133D1|nr:Stk1 family PASTA domain-containing Ser/Thr kinase [Buchananella hordeovulneris]MDO5080072.1 Stk1 family PASTA domain-containing Ser/Thr kinase [Buchananella hordeovulneris]